MELHNLKIAVIGLGYVGLPIAVAFSEKYDVIGFDINTGRINELQSGIDNTKELTTTELKQAKAITYTNNLDSIVDATVFIVTVPTPVDKNNHPDLSPLIQASNMLGKILKKGDTVIYESTVYPGVTEDECIPVLELGSGLKVNIDFFVGYSPERINPADKKHRITDILKVTSGSTSRAAEFIDSLYASVIKAGTHKAPSIKVAEAAKVIENVQRDVNIALINELHQIFCRLNICTADVIEAASTKWNFMKFSPGLVGGHCISVDPYYLFHKSQTSGYVPDLMRKAREINNSMASFLANDFIANLLKNSINPLGLKVAIFGISFKENCPDLRNTKVITLCKELMRLGLDVKVYDSTVSVTEYLGVTLHQVSESTEKVGFIAVGHDDVLTFCKQKSFDYLYDYKGYLG